LITVYYITSYFLYPFDLKLGEKFQKFLTNQLTVLGPLDKAQKITLVIFTMTCSLWIFKNPLNGFIGSTLLTDTHIALFGGILLFLIPVTDGKATLSTSDISSLPWNIVLLFGGGMAMANALSSIGVLEEVSQLLEASKSIDIYWFVFISSVLVLFLTEVMSNVALCTVALPVFLTLAKTQGVHPLVVGIPISLCSSYAFSMPISTPPNAIVFATGKLSMKHMLRAGILLNIIGIMLTMTISWGMIRIFY
jgi:sodium-dependent dicarboxylate transporter 2/3/5